MNKTTKIISLVTILAGAACAWAIYPAATQWVNAQTAATKNRSTVTREMYVYLTKSEYDGNLGGFTGANQKCEQDRPVDVPSGLNYQAFLGAASGIRTVNGVKEYGWSQKPTNVDWNTLVHGVNDGNTGYMTSWCGGCSASKVIIPKVNTVIVNGTHPRYENGNYPYSENDLQYGLAGLYRGARKLGVGTGDPRAGTYDTSSGLGLDNTKFWSWGAPGCSAEQYSGNGSVLKNCSSSKHIPSPFAMDGQYYGRNVWDMTAQSAFTVGEVNYNACNSWTSNGSNDKAYTGDTHHDFSWDNTDFSYTGHEEDGHSFSIPGLTNQDGKRYEQIYNGRPYDLSPTRPAIWSRDQVSSCAEKHRILCFAQPK